MVHLQKVHDKQARRGISILGFNTADRPEIAEALLEKFGVTYRSVLDNSTDAQLVASRDYRVEAVPTTYVIDRDGKIAAAWIGHDPIQKEREAILRRLGID